jgi:hypothetical protein
MSVRLAWLIRKTTQSEQGMSVVELAVAVGLFAAFMGVFVAVTEVMGRYAQDGEQRNAEEPSRSLIVDQHYLQQAMDDLSERIAQPALSRETVKAIVMPVNAAGRQGNCTYDPVNTWQLPGTTLGERYKKQLPAAYQFCIHATSLAEASEAELISDPIASRGIYVITAIPDQSSINKQPARRLICRPRPFCS